VIRFCDLIMDGTQRAAPYRRSPLRNKISGQQAPKEVGVENPAEENALLSGV
jgi:hypothetical protein